MIGWCVFLLLLLNIFNSVICYNVYFSVWCGFFVPIFTSSWFKSIDLNIHGFAKSIGCFMINVHLHWLDFYLILSLQGKHFFTLFMLIVKVEKNTIEKECIFISWNLLLYFRSFVTVFLNFISTSVTYNSVYLCIL